jgi:CRISPR-associated endonuclease/helicase Cas3
MKLGDFAEAFNAVHNRPPFPWQQRLATTLCESGQWPSLINIPTGCGKTATLDIALFHLAWCAHHALREQIRRRIVFVVNRRVIVDEAHDRACRLQEALVKAVDRNDALGRWARALRSLGGDLPVAAWRLRGGVPRERGFARDPLQAMILAATVDQIGSRLLFRGYGVSPYSWPLHAGLLGLDTLILADEAHLAEPLLDTLESVALLQNRSPAQSQLPPPVKAVQLTATGRVYEGAFSLSDDDLKHEVLSERIGASKPVQLAQLKAREMLAERLAHEACAALETQRTHHPNAVIAVVVNRVATARAVFERIRARFPDEDASALFIGRSRPFDRERLMSEWTPRLKSARDQQDEKSAIIVATQTIEVGADFDFQGLVTELASWDALRQRFGRLNRLGHFNHAHGVIVAPAKINEDDPIYGATLRPTFEFLMSEAGQDHVLDFSLANLARMHSRAPTKAALAPERGPLLTQSLVDLFSQTSPRPQPDPEVAPFLHGFERGEPEVQLIFRAGMQLDEHRKVNTSDMARHRLAQLLDALPPSSRESLALPRSVFLRWISALDEANSNEDPASLSDVESVLRPEGLRKKSSRKLWFWDGDKLNHVNPENIGSNGVAIIPCEWRGCDGYGYAPNMHAAVRDLAEVATVDERGWRKQSRRRSIVLMPERLSNVAWIVPPRNVEGNWTAQMIVNLLRRDLKQVAEAGSDPKATVKARLDDPDFRSWLSPEVSDWLRVDDEVLDVKCLYDQDDTPFAFHLTYGKPRREDLSDEDLMSSRSVVVELKEHSLGVERWARRFVEGAKLSTETGEDVVLAARLHDLGKAEPRFQRLLGGRGTGDANTLLAKSSGQGKSSHELGARHECYSVSLIAQNPELTSNAVDRNLVEHLVGTHHGRGRALMPHVSDLGRDFPLLFEGTDLQHRGAPNLGVIGSGWADRFWRLLAHYGPWGLAYLETLVRLADHRQSAEEADNG